MANVRCVISDKYKALVLLLPKNASSTIRAELKKETFGGYERYARELNDEQKTYKKAAFLRNPLERFLSAYHEVYIRHNGQAEYFKRNKIDQEQTLNFLSIEDKLETIDEFLDHIEQKGFFENHIKPQVAFIGDLPIDYYYSIEHLQADLNLFFAELGAPQLSEVLPLHRKRRVRRDKRNYIYWKEELPPKLIERINEIYALDVQLYQEQILTKINGL